MSITDPVKDKSVEEQFVSDTSIKNQVKKQIQNERTRKQNSNSEELSLIDVKDVEIDTALATIDQVTLYGAQRSMLTTQIWDRISPINGVPAQYFLDRDDVDENDDNDIYLILREGVVVGFQPHEPDTAGLIRIPKGQGKIRGNKHADSLALEEVTSEINRMVKDTIKANRKTKGL